MLEFTTLVGKYNATALTLQDGEYSILALDSNSRIIQDHTTSSIKLGDGVDILDIMANSSVATLTEKGLAPLAVRKDVIGSLVDADGDFSFLQLDAQGRLRVDAEVSVNTGSDKIEDTAAASGDVGTFVLGVRNDSDVVLTSDDGDYSPISVDNKGRVKTVTELKEKGLSADIGVDEDNDGEIEVAYHASNFVDLATINVGAGETLSIEAFQVSCDVLTEFRLVVLDDTTLQTVLRKLPITENVGNGEWTFKRAREIVGGANIKVVLQGRCMRNGKTSRCGGGINAYK